MTYLLQLKCFYLNAVLQEQKHFQDIDEVLETKEESMIYTLVTHCISRKSSIGEVYDFHLHFVVTIR